MAANICRLCSGRIASDELQEHLTGEYHKICMSTIVAADLGIDFVKYPELCAWCGEVISANSVIARSGELVVHLGCFFGHDQRKSLGAAAAMPTLKDRSRLLRQYSGVLQRKARSVQERAAATRVRYTPWLT